MAELSYQIPSAGRAKRIMRIPESHALYLCPNSCGRRQGIRALRNGVADHASFLRFSQTDIVLGDYQNQVVDAVAQLLDAVRPAPRVIMLYVNCIDDFLGTDEESLLIDLRDRFAPVRFLLSHINPIAADMTRSTARNIHTRLYEALERANARDRAVNFVGNFEAPAPTCELYAALRALGVSEVRQIVSCETFRQYLDLAKSDFTISLSHLGDDAAALMEERFSIPSMSWHATYDMDEIDRRYAELAQFLALRRGDPVEALDWKERFEAALIRVVAPARRAAESALSVARAAVGNLPVMVDSSASLMPFSLALALLGEGFNVVAVFGLHLKGCDDAAERHLLQHFPQVRVIRAESHQVIQGYGLPEDCLSIGTDAAFLVRAQHVIDMYHDEGFLGFQGVERLAWAMVGAVACADGGTGANASRAARSGA